MNNTKIIVDGIELDPSNDKFFKAADIVLNTNIPVVYLTGKAGTGKSLFVRYIKTVYTQDIITLAPTGVAAVNVQGQTIHSFFGLGFNIYSPDDDRLSSSTIQSHLRFTAEHRELIRNTNMIIIDEVSMVRCDILDCVDRILRHYRKSSLPFGGVKMLLVGDVFQLPPVVKSEERLTLSRYYDSEFFFDSKVYRKSSPVYIQLDRIYRQEEQEFLSLLEKVRIGNITKQELAVLNQNSSNRMNENTIVLSSMVVPAEDYNSKMLDSIESDVVELNATICGQYPAQIMPVEANIRLKIGAQVMIMRNNLTLGSSLYYNGQIGIVSDIKENYIMVKCDGRDVSIEKAVWENNVYIWDRVSRKCSIETIGTFEQYPLKLAWAITIHKSQGLTFDNVSINLSSWVAKGGVYVALSRCKTLSGIHVVRPLALRDIKIDSRVLRFAQTETPDILLAEIIKKFRLQQTSTEQNDLFATIEKGIQEQEYVIPKQNINYAKPKQIFHIDVKKISELEAQTKEAHEILSDIFSDIEEAENALMLQMGPILEILEILLTKKCWQRTKVEAVCQSRNMMLGALLEKINDYAYERVNDTLIEEDVEYIYIATEYKNKLL